MHLIINKKAAYLFLLTQSYWHVNVLTVRMWSLNLWDIQKYIKKVYAHEFA